MKLRVWWIPQVPMKSFNKEVKTLREGKLLLETLADYDLFQYENRVKPDYSNAGGLSVWDQEEQEWLDWEDEEARTIDNLSMDEDEKLDAVYERRT